MKRSLYLIIFIVLICSARSARAQGTVDTVYSSMDSLRYMLGMSLSHDQKKFDNYKFPYLAYLQYRFHPDGLEIDVPAYRKKLNDYYYKRLHLFDGIIEPGSVVSHDCLKEEETSSWNKAYLLLFQSIYQGPGWVLPADFAKQAEEQATQDPFYGPVQALINIYYLKELGGYARLPKDSRKAVSELENRFCKYLYENHITGKPWSYRRLFALWAIRINGNPAADAVQVAELTDQFDRTTFQLIFKSDLESMQADKKAIQEGDYMVFFNRLCTLWLFCLHKSG